MKEINQVRQVLVNELGLTRESIREMAREFVAEAVAKEVHQLQHTGIIERIVKEKLNDLCKTSGHWANRDTFRGMVVAEAEKQIREFIEKKVQISA